MSEFVDVPVTRRARITLVGKVVGEAGWPARSWVQTCAGGTALAPGDQVVVRPYLGARVRGGIGVVTHDGLDLTGIPAACDGDLLYRVEPAP